MQRNKQCRRAKRWQKNLWTKPKRRCK